MIINRKQGVVISEMLFNLFNVVNYYVMRPILSCNLLKCLIRNIYLYDLKNMLLKSKMRCKLN